MPYAERTVQSLPTTGRSFLATSHSRCQAAELIIKCGATPLYCEFAHIWENMARTSVYARD